MSALTYETAPNETILVNGTNFAYRRLGASSGVPLVFLIHFRGNMDHWDPALINPIAAVRPVILIDNAGTGRSDGEIPDNFPAWAQNIIDVLSTLKIKQVDVLGFSMGGCVGQLIALNAPSLVRRLVLAGTTPSIGEGITAADPQWGTMLATAVEEEEVEKAMIACFFSLSEKKQAVGEKWWKRMTGARKDRAPFLQGVAIKRQWAALERFSDLKYRDEGTYNRLDQIKIPVLVANGSNDRVIPTNNSWILYQRLVNAEASLHFFPDSSHGFLDEYSEVFSKMVLDFLAD